MTRIEIRKNYLNTFKFTKFIKNLNFPNNAISHQINHYRAYVEITLKIQRNAIATNQLILFNVNTISKRIIFV